MDSNKKRRLDGPIETTFFCHWCQRHYTVEYRLLEEYKHDGLGTYACENCSGRYDYEQGWGEDSSE